MSTSRPYRSLTCVSNLVVSAGIVLYVLIHLVTPKTFSFKRGHQSCKRYVLHEIPRHKAFEQFDCHYYSGEYHPDQ